MRLTWLPILIKPKREVRSLDYASSNMQPSPSRASASSTSFRDGRSMRDEAFAGLSNDFRCQRETLGIFSAVIIYVSKMPEITVFVLNLWNCKKTRRSRLK